MKFSLHSRQNFVVVVNISVAAPPPPPPMTGESLSQKKKEPVETYSPEILIGLFSTMRRFE